MLKYCSYQYNWQILLVKLRLLEWIILKWDTSKLAMACRKQGLYVWLFKWVTLSEARKRKSNCYWEIKSTTKSLLSYICCVSEHVCFSGAATLDECEGKWEGKLKTKSKQNYCASCPVTLKLQLILKSVSLSDYKCMAYIEDILSIIQNFATEIKEDPKPEKIFWSRDTEPMQKLNCFKPLWLVYNDN